MNPDKIICPCCKVKKGDIVKAVEKGAGSSKEVREMTKAGKGCGKCKDKVKKFTKEILKKQKK